MNQSPLLAAALDAAQAAEPVIRKYFQAGIAVRRKADQSPVTQADIEAENAIRAVLGRSFPDHGFFGEELGRSSGEHDYLWLIDPIDGTKSFVRGHPMFSTQIALCHRNRLVLGVSRAGLYGETAWAERGCGAWMNDQRIEVSGCDRLADAVLSCGNVRTLAADAQAWQRLGALVGLVDRFRGYGDFLHYHLLASGRIDVVLESDLNILDVAALAVIIEEAGGVVTQLDGQPLQIESTTLLAAASPALHAEVLNRIGDGRRR